MPEMVAPRALVSDRWSRVTKLWERDCCSPRELVLGAFHICQTDRSEISGNTRGKWNHIFRLNRANQQKWLLTGFVSFYSECPQILLQIIEARAY